MSYTITSAATQPKTASALLDFTAGPFAYLNQIPAIRLTMQLAILNGMLPVFQAYPTYNQSIINQIITQIKILTSQQLAAGRPV